MKTEKLTIDLLAFGQLTDITGKSNWQMQEVSDTDHLKAMLVEEFPRLSQSKYLVAVNMEIVRSNVALKSGDVVALLPPFSGG